MNFKEKVQSMSGKEILGAMIQGLKKEHYKVRMNSWGHEEDGICYGCAAINCITEISGILLTAEQMVMNKLNTIDRENYRFVSSFEDAINELRQGDIEDYNFYATLNGFAILKEPKFGLPHLTDTHWKEDLIYYEKFYESLND